jgi:hypothetical protein
MGVKEIDDEEVYWIRLAQDRYHCWAFLIRAQHKFGFVTYSVVMPQHSRVQQSCTSGGKTKRPVRKLSQNITTKANPPLICMQNAPPTVKITDNCLRNIA